MFWYARLDITDNSMIALEIENKEAFFPLVKALFPNKKIKWFTGFTYYTLSFEKFEHKPWIIPIEVIMEHEDTKYIYTKYHL
jgi:hypothetical protein